VTGGDSVEQRRFGDHLDHDQRYERTEEFIAILRGVGDDGLGPGETFSFAGRHYDVADARIALGGWPRPEVFFGGASPAAERVAARQADTYLAWGETPEQIAQRLDRMRALADEEGRELTFGIRLHVISRDTSAAAWAEADRLLAGLSAERIAAARAQLTASESVGQQRMLALHGGGRLEVAPNLWAGYGLVRGGAGTALVGSHDEVADRIAEYHELGIDHFILSGQPHLEEAFWFGEGAADVLRARGLLNPIAQEVTGA
jgi:alkanesulfonate monooxygenase